MNIRQHNVHFSKILAGGLSCLLFLSPASYGINLGPTYDTTDTSTSVSQTYYANGMVVGEFTSPISSLPFVVEPLPTDGAKKLFYLSKRNIVAITEVDVDFVPLSPTQYTYNLESGFVTFRIAYTSGQTVQVKYRTSGALDVVTGMDNSSDGVLYHDMYENVSSGGSHGLNLLTGKIPTDGSYDTNAVIAACGDLDGNGYVDILRTSSEWPDVYILFNQGPATGFVQGPMAAFGYTWPLDIDCMDFNGDGFMDFVLDDALEGIKLYFNDGTNNFALVQRIYGDYQAVEPGDADLDGDNDLVADSHDYNTKIFEYDPVSGPFIYYAQSAGSTLHKITEYSDKEVGTELMSGGTPTPVGTISISGIDADDNYIYFADHSYNRIFRMHERDKSVGWTTINITAGDVAVDASYLYAINNSDGNLYIFNKGNLFQIQTFTDANIASSYGIAVNASYLYFSDPTNNKVHQYSKGIPGTSNPTFLQTITTDQDPSTPVAFNYPIGMITDGGFLYIADRKNHRAVKLNASDLSYVGEVGSYGYGNYQYADPWDVALSGGDLLIGVYGDGIYPTSRIVRLDAATLTYKDEVTITGSDKPQWIGANPVASDATVYLHGPKYKESLFLDYTGTQFRWGDLDNDGDLDVGVTVSNSMTYQDHWLENTSSPGNISFTYDVNVNSIPTDQSVGSLSTQDFDIADFDGDGDMDIVAGYVNNASIVRYFENDGTGVFTEKGNYDYDPAAKTVVNGIRFADLNNDGALDIVATKNDITWENPVQYAGLIVLENVPATDIPVTVVTSTVDDGDFQVTERCIYAVKSDKTIGNKISCDVLSTTPSPL